MICSQHDPFTIRTHIMMFIDEPRHILCFLSVCRWYFALISISGIFAVTFSVIFAYVADITEEHERSTAYGLVSATFAASLVTSPAIGAYLSAQYGDSLVVLVATVIAVADIAFVFFVVPESLPDKMRTSWGFPIPWEQADPFSVSSEVTQQLRGNNTLGLIM
ncbi:hippocampus abundant transcript 1 protein-like [Anarrhichthys ocellatus]|uniref:hippocampus abundant transcript 1 protein-like n=1 Tax=Anarrhichthys ocellatus TaxID=433405 RepID=UPI0012EDC2EA|nr:hippocampus abundant transcript 1 protein-like [Anarrhichthys ocellatus]